MNARATLRLTLDCDNACRFCAQAGAADSQPEDLQSLREHADAITFVGGEPTRAPDLVERIAAAHSLGFTAIGLQTNGRALAEDPRRLADLVAAGLTDLHLSIHGPNAACHDYHSDRPGSFAAAMTTLDRAARAGLTCVVATVITRSNFRELRAMPAMLKRRGVGAWLLEVVRPAGRANQEFTRIIPRFGMALPYALHALEQARRQALSAWIRGAPLCALGPFVSVALADEPRSYAQPCEACPSRSSCPGVDAEYLEVFGARELKPRPAPEPTDYDAGRLARMAMFVGVGERVVGEPVLHSKPPPTPESPPVVSGKLPILGQE